MSESDDGQNTRPISVAELLARNGTIGAPPAGGRRRKRRGNADAISVAELTGEIPIIRDEPPVEVRTEADDAAEPEAENPVDEITDEVDEVEPEAEAGAAEESDETTFDEVDGVEIEVDEAEVDEAEVDQAEVDEAEVDEAEVDQIGEPEADADEDPAQLVEEEAQNEDVEPEPVAVVAVVEVPADAPDEAPVEAPVEARPEVIATPPSGAEQMAPDPVDDSVDLDELLADHEHEAEALRSYLKDSSGALFSGGTIADDIARRGGAEPEAMAEDAADARVKTYPESPTRGRLGGFRAAMAAVFQSVLAVVFGAGLFLAFDQLWRWNTIVALVLSVLVILGLVIAVRVVRKTEDIASTLIAVAVGALVTLGPLALLQST